MMKLFIENITKSYDGKEVLKGASMTFEQGKIYGLIGRNGAGKTTLFNCLSDEIKADKGKARITDAHGRCAHLLDTNDIGYVFSTPVLPDFLTGYEFLKFYIDINRGSRSDIKSIDEYFDMVQMPKDDRFRLIKGYSHGMKSKIQMLCFIIAKPPVILLDEPLTAFDVVASLEMKRILKDMKRDHIIIFSTHILQLATNLCDEIVILNDGKLSQIDSYMLRRKDFEERIIELLKDGDEDA